MYSRAHLLIELEQEKLLVDPPWGIEAWPLYDDTIFEWIAKMKGLKNTPWEGGIFKVYIKFDEHFNVRPPHIVFQTIPFHPNVDVITGRPCADFLDDYLMWHEDYSLSMMLVSIQTLLSNPVCEKAVNAEAAQMLLTSPELYHQMIRKCVAMSQMVEAETNVNMSPDRRLNRLTPDKSGMAPSRTGSTRVKKLSFEEYHNSWLGIATSKTTTSTISPLIVSFGDQHDLHKTHLCLSTEEFVEPRGKQLDHSMLVYGHFKNRKLSKSDRVSKLAQLNRMKQIYLPPRQSPSTSRHDMNTEQTFSESCVRGMKEAWEEEVDDLVKWSHNLDSDIIDTR